jgi:hypothetical protein
MRLHSTLHDRERLAEVILIIVAILSFGGVIYLDFLR